MGFFYHLVSDDPLLFLSLFFFPGYIDPYLIYVLCFQNLILLGINKFLMNDDAW